MKVRLRLLGMPRLEANGGVSELPLDRPASLGYYLAQRGDWVRRSELAYLYSPEADEASAFNNLRKLVFRLKQQGWAKTLEAEPSRLRLNLPTDVQAFQVALQRQDWAEALDQYGGTFLEGLTFPDLSGYEAWMELERQDLLRAWRGALLEQVRLLEGRAEWPQAELGLGRLLKADPLDEDAVQALLRVLQGVGKVAQAREVFERFRGDLALEMGVEPLESTRVLADSLRSAPVAVPVEATRPKHNLPAVSTRFIGRKKELEALTRQVANPDCRLLTLVGLGGMGKTRLALELAGQQIERFADGVWLVPLAGLSGADMLVSSLASALGMVFSGPSDPKVQLQNYLRNKELLLLLDNFEHLLEGGLLLEELLAQAPGLKLLATSRVALEVGSEWLYDLEGLAYPRQGAADLEGFESVRLFVQRAERLSTHFVLTAPTLEAIAELCRRVQGMPLALELAATWVRGLSVLELVAQLSHSFDLLQTTQPDLPERHRNLQAVLEYTWQLLPAPEQVVLARLSVFRGGFTLEAAQSVAGAHLGLLLRFINHALVRRSEDGRYDLHELVREFLAGKLEHMGEQTTNLERYLGYLQELAKVARNHLGRPEHLTWNARLRAEHDNFSHALERGFIIRPGDAVNLVAQLGHYWHTRGLFDQGDRWLRRSMAHLTDLPLDVQVRISIEHLRLVLIRGQMEEAAALELPLLLLCNKVKDPDLEAEVYDQIGWAAVSQRQFEKAEMALEKGLGLVEQTGNTRLKANLLLNMARMAGFQKDSVRAFEFQQAVLELARTNQDIHMQMRCLVTMAWVDLMKGEYGQSVAFSQEALSLAKLLDSSNYTAIIQGNLGYALWQLGDHAAGERAYREHLILHFEQGAMTYFYENAFELAQFWNHLGYSEDAVCLWGIAEQVRTTHNYPLFEGFDTIKTKVLEAIAFDKRQVLLRAGQSKSPQELLNFIKHAARP